MERMKEEGERLMRERWNEEMRDNEGMKTGSKNRKSKAKL